MVKHKPPMFGAAQGVAKVLEDKIAAVKPQLAPLAFKRPQLLERKTSNSTYRKWTRNSVSVLMDAGLVLGAHRAQLQWGLESVPRTE